VGVRVLLLALRTGGLAELTFGMAVVFIVGLGYPLVLFAPPARPDSTASLVTRVVASTGTVFLALGWCSLWTFTWRIFRPDAVWARALAITGIGAIAAFTCWRVARVLGAADYASLAQPTPDALGNQCLAIVVYIWTGLEGARYYGLLRRRVRLGLADPVVANRFLLWGLVGLFSFLSLIGPTWATVVRPDAETMASVRVATALAGLVCAGLLYLGFLPPPGYLRWVRGAPAAA
jgi:hypothetical protein